MVWGFTCMGVVSEAEALGTQVQLGAWGWRADEAGGGGEALPPSSCLV